MTTARIRSQIGAFTPLMGVAMLLLGVMAIGGAAIGRLTLVRSDAQRSADGAALAAVRVVRDLGLPFQGATRSAAQRVGNANTDFPITYYWEVDEQSDTVEIAVTATIQVASLFGTKSVVGHAVAQIPQARFDEAERRLPKLVMALDYSGSMAWEFSGGGRKIDALEDSISALLSKGLMVEYGAAFYSTNVFSTVGVSPGAPGQISNIMATYDAGGATNTAGALAASRNLLTNTDNTGWYVLLVSDGAPNGGGDPRPVATSLWNRDITIFTLEIRDSPPNPTLAKFMTDVAGSPGSRGDPAYHFVAESADDLVNEFERVVASIVCRVGPMSPAPADPGTLHAFLDRGGNERVLPQLPAGADPADYAGQEMFWYDAGNQTVRLTMAACDAVIDYDDEIVVRFDQPTLIE